MKQIKQYLKLLFILVLFNFCGCWLFPQNTVVVPVGTSNFEPEYDYQVGYDVFPYPDEDQFVIDAFSDCSTVFYARYNDGELEVPAVDISYNSISVYGKANRDYLADGSAEFGGYLIAMSDVVDKPTVLGSTGSVIMGVTVASTAGTREGMAFIFVKAVQDEFSTTWRDVVKGVTVHELRHLRANLTHLCEWKPNFNGPGQGAWVQDGDHDACGCVMGAAPNSLCTSCNTSKNPTFCNADKKRLKKITWE